jgi:hypothetical protein
MPTPPPFNRVVTIKKDPDTSIQIVRGTVPVQIADNSPVESTAEWRTRYQLPESDGSKSDMITHMIVIAGRDDHYYLIGYVAPAADTAGQATFAQIVKSLTVPEK